MIRTLLSANREAVDLNPPSPLHRWLVWLLFCAAILTLFYRLGAAALFEPDEGRNSEKAREILILNDWITPHENFHVVLDKPIFFYWLVALSYKMFGISEWAARLPSALAALGCLAVVYRFVRRHWGTGEALWSTVILLGSGQFFILSRVVIFDVPLTCFITLALCMFFEALHTTEPRRRMFVCLIMYAALGAGTLIKGLVGVVVPGIVFFLYLLLTKRWDALKEIYLIPGTLLYLAIVLPWYLQAEARNSGYLRYYLWDEHFGRFATAKFDRTQPWYYFVGVLTVGFLPWTVLLSAALKELGKTSLADKNLFLILWAGLPLLFFSLSNSKLPHYILPVFPALAILSGVTLTRMLRGPERHAHAWISATWWIQGLCVFYLLVGLYRPEILPGAIRGSVGHLAWFLRIYGAVLVIFLAVSLFTRNTGFWAPPDRLFIVNCVATVLFSIFLAEMKVATAPERSAKGVGQTVARNLPPAAQIVFYDTYLAGLPFYLTANKPVWLVTHENKRNTFLGNFYAIGKRSEVTTKWGDAVFNFDEFHEIWHSGKQPLLIIVKEKNLARMEAQVGGSAGKIATVDEYVLLSRP